jgi:hypothetical protein
LFPQDVEISDDVFLIQREVAEAYKSADGNPIQVAGGPPVAVAPSAPRLPLGGGGMPEPEVSTTGESGAPAAKASTAIVRIINEPMLAIEATVSNTPIKYGYSDVSACREA